MKYMNALWVSPLGRVGWVESGLARSGSTQKGGNRRAGTRNGACVAGSVKVGCWNYAAVVFFAGLGCAFGLAFFAACAFSFAVNSCFTLRAMASVSTL